MTDRELVQSYDTTARLHPSTPDGEYRREAALTAMHAELVARGIDWEDPRWFA